MSTHHGILLHVIFSVKNRCRHLPDAWRDYIANQREHHRKHTFESEYIAFLEKHRIEYDPRYVFETDIIG